MPSKEEEKYAAYIPPEIIKEILARLPIHSLFRCILVSKSWCRTILHDPDFAKSHRAKNGPSLIFFAPKKCSVIWHLTSYMRLQSNLRLLERASINGTEWHPSTATSIHTYFDSYNDDKQKFKVVGSCNGLLCLNSWRRLTREQVLVCNPLTKEYTTLPVETTTKNVYIDGSLGMGFGFDSVRVEYKAVRLVCQSRPPHEWEAEVHTLGTDSWRRIANFPSKLCASYPFSDVLVNGALHWRAEKSCFHHRGDFAHIVALNMSDEKFHGVQVPSCGPSWISFDTQLMSWNGYLSMVEHTSAENYSASGFGLWVMKEYNVKESWTKMYNITWPAWLTKFHGQYWPIDDESGRDLQVPDQDHLFEVIGHFGTLRSLKLLIPGTKLITKIWKQQIIG